MGRALHCGEKDNMGVAPDHADVLAHDEENGMGCVLRVWGDEFDIDNLLSHVRITPCSVQRKGLPRFGPQSRVATATGFNIVTSEASECDLSVQINDTIAFLRLHNDDLAAIMSFPGVAGAMLDFSVESRLGGDIIGQNDSLPSELLLLAGTLGIGINLTQYARGDTDVSDRS
jgi:hypothetical protein